MTGWQLSGDGPPSCIQFASYVMEPRTDDLIRQTKCNSATACGTLLAL